MLYIGNTENPCVESEFKIAKVVDSLPEDFNKYWASIDNFFVSIFVVNAVLWKFCFSLGSVNLCKLWCVFLVIVDDELKHREAKEGSLHVNNGPEIDQIEIKIRSAQHISPKLC